MPPCPPDDDTIGQSPRPRRQLPDIRIGRRFDRICGLITIRRGLRQASPIFYPTLPCLPTY